MAGRRKVTGRFFVILGIVAAIVAFAIYMSREDPVREVVVEAGSIGQTREMDAVIMRGESVVSTESYARVDYVAEECALVSAGYQKPCKKCRKGNGKSGEHAQGDTRVL